jgi:hypothetical protein
VRTSCCVTHHDFSGWDGTVWRCRHRHGVGGGMAVLIEAELGLVSLGVLPIT